MEILSTNNLSDWSDYFVQLKKIACYCNLGKKYLIKKVSHGYELIFKDKILRVNKLFETYPKQC